MAKEIDKIIQSKTAPKSNNVLWDDGENLKINRNGKWENANNAETNNLDIDPIVWKYMCNPYVVENEVPLPEELRNIIEYETGGLNRIALKIFLMVDYDGNFHTITHMSDNTIHSSFASFVYNKEAGYFEVV
jgi:hypothetical protein